LYRILRINFNVYVTIQHIDEIIICVDFCVHMLCNVTTALLGWWWWRWPSWWPQHVGGYADYNKINLHTCRCNCWLFLI